MKTETHTREYTVYVASDGSKFTTEQLCNAHELDLLFEKQKHIETELTFNMGLGRVSYFSTEAELNIYKSATRLTKTFLGNPLVVGEGYFFGYSHFGDEFLISIRELKEIINAIPTTVSEIKEDTK